MTGASSSRRATLKIDLMTFYAVFTFIKMLTNPHPSSHAMCAIMLAGSVLVEAQVAKA